MDYLDTIIGNMWARQQREEQREEEPFYVDDEYTDKDLHDNIMDGNMIFIEKYLMDGGNPSRIIMGQFSLLMTAVYFNNISIVRLLLIHKANLENEQSEGNTALSYAAKFGEISINILDLLLKNGANPNHFSEIAVSRRGNAHTPLSNCIRNSRQNDYLNKLKLLLEYSANPNKKDAYGVNALHDAINILNPPKLSETIKILLIYGADIDSVDGGGDSVLFRARLNNSPDALVTLLELGADPYIKNNDGYNVLKDSYFRGAHARLPRHQKILYETINNLHKTNVAYQMLAISKGLDNEHSIEELDEDTLYKLYLSLLEKPYNPLLTRERNQEDLKDITTYGKYIKHVKKGGKRINKRSKHGSNRSKKRTKKNVLPKLKPINDKNVKHKYKLNDPQNKRILAINEGINAESKKTGKTIRKAAISKKGRFNILRIYRKNKRPKECKRITSDMKYIDKKYGLGKTKNICKRS